MGRAAEKTEGKTAPQKSGEGSQKAKSSELEKEVKQESLPDIFVRQMSTRCLLPDSLLKKEAEEVGKQETAEISEQVAGGEPALKKSGDDSQKQQKLEAETSFKPDTAIAKSAESQ